MTRIPARPASGRRGRSRPPEPAAPGPGPGVDVHALPPLEVGPGERLHEPAGRVGPDQGLPLRPSPVGQLDASRPRRGGQRARVMAGSRPPSDWAETAVDDHAAGQEEAADHLAGGLVVRASSCPSLGTMAPAWPMKIGREP